MSLIFFNKCFSLKLWDSFKNSDQNSGFVLSWGSEIPFFLCTKLCSNFDGIPYRVLLVSMATWIQNRILGSLLRVEKASFSPSLVMEYIVGVKCFLNGTFVLTSCAINDFNSIVVLHPYTLSLSLNENLKLPQVLILLWIANASLCCS